MCTAPSEGVLAQAVLLASRAPSLHNSQPWRWVFDGAELQLFSVRDRMLRATDASGKQMVLSCGVVLDHLRAALAAEGWRTAIDRFPDPNRADHLASIRMYPAQLITDADVERAQAIRSRRTDRRPFAEPPGWDEFEPILRSTIPAGDLSLDVLPADCRPALARASRLTAALRRYDAGYQAELRWWTGNAATGMPQRALLNAQDRAAVSVGRVLPDGTAAAEAGIPVDRSTVLVLSTGDDSAAEVLHCGEVLSTVLLECTIAGYATCTLTHITELAQSRSILRSIMGGAVRPQALVRVGSVTDHDVGGAATPRRPLADVFETQRKDSRDGTQ